jgi:hypothetical protein
MECTKATVDRFPTTRSPEISLIPDSSDLDSDSDSEDQIADFATQKKQVENEAWYFGAMIREEAIKLVPNVGDFLVRDSCTINDLFVLTVRNADQVTHFRLVNKDGSAINGKKSVKDLMDYYIARGYIKSTDDVKNYLIKPAKIPYTELLFID